MSHNSFIVLIIASMLFSTMGFQINPHGNSARFLYKCKLQSTNTIVTKNANADNRNLEMRWGLKGPQLGQNQLSDDGKALRDTVPFEIRGFSLPAVVFSVGVILTASSFVNFFSSDGGSDGAVSSIGFVYGIPVFLIGLSLWYAEIAPVEVISDEAGDRAWANKASDTFIKVKADVTRHRYGDDAHLDTTLEALGLKLQGKKFPKLVSLTQEELENGELAFTLAFQSLDTPYKTWAEPARVKKYSTFFGPNVDAEVFKLDSEKRIVALKLTTLAPGAVPTAGTVAAVDEEEEVVEEEKGGKVEARKLNI